MLPEVDGVDFFSFKPKRNLTAGVLNKPQPIAASNLVVSEPKSTSFNRYGPGGQLNWLFGAAAFGVENTSGSFRLSTKKLGFSPKYYANAWRGNQYAKTFNIGNFGKFLGYGSVGIGFGMDIYGVRNYYKYGPDNPNSVHPAKFGLNTGVSVYGIWISGPGAMLYFGVDAFHPGGWPGFIEGMGTINRDLQRSYGPEFRLVPFGPK